MTRAGILTKYSLGYMLPGKASLSQGAGKILQMVGRARETVEKRGSKCESGWKKDRGRERKENRGPRIVTSNVPNLADTYMHTVPSSPKAKYLWEAFNHAKEYTSEARDRTSPLLLMNEESTAKSHRHKACDSPTTPITPATCHHSPSSEAPCIRRNSEDFYDDYKDPSCYNTPTNFSFLPSSGPPSTQPTVPLPQPISTAPAPAPPAQSTPPSQPAPVMILGLVGPLLFYFPRTLFPY